MAKAPSKETNFIRQHPTKRPAEVVVLAAKAGLKIDAQKVYNVRKSDRVLAKARGAAKGSPVRTARKASAMRRSAPKAAAPAGPFPAASAERELRRIVLELGLLRAGAILADVRARVLAALA